MVEMVEMWLGEVLGGWGLGVGMLVGLVGREFVVCCCGGGGGGIRRWSG